MELNYNQARHLKGKIISFKNQRGIWSVGRVSRVKKDGLLIEELRDSGSHNGYGYPFWGGGAFFGPPVFFPFVGIGFNPFFF